MILRLYKYTGSRCGKSHTAERFYNAGPYARQQAPAIPEPGPVRGAQRASAATAVSRATSIIWVKVFWRSSAVVSSPVII